MKPANKEKLVEEIVNKSLLVLNTFLDRMLVDLGVTPEQIKQAKEPNPDLIEAEEIDDRTN